MARREFAYYPKQGLALIHFSHLGCCLQTRGGGCLLELRYFLEGAPISVSGRAELGSTSLSLAQPP